MRGNKRSNTKPEIALRSALHRLGYRYRTDHLIVAGETRVRADIVFTRQRVAVFIDGCFWHSCPEHGSQPRHNSAYWTKKLARNRARDDRVNAALTSTGWHVIRLWEHTSTPDAQETIVSALHQE